MWNVNKTESSERTSNLLNSEWKKAVVRYRKLNDNFNTNKKPNQDENETEYLNKKTLSNSIPSPVKKPSLALCLWKIYYGKFLAGALLKFFLDLILNFIPPLLLDKLISFFNDTKQNVQVGYFYAGLLFVCLVLKSLVYNHHMDKMTCVGARVRTSLMNLVFQKSLNLSSNSRRLTSVGEMTNLISVDAAIFVELMMYVNNLWSAPIQILICVFLLWRYLGIASLAGLLVMVLSIPLNALINEKSRRLDIKKLKYQDMRIKMINELLNGIKVIKFFGLELSFQRIIRNIRKNELENLVKSSLLKCGINFTYDCAPILVASATFVTFILIDSSNKLETNTFFVSLALLDLMKSPVILLPWNISMFIKGNISLKRLRDFLLNEEIDENYFENYEEQNPQNYQIILKDMDLGWDRDDPILKK